MGGRRRRPRPVGGNAGVERIMATPSTRLGEIGFITENPATQAYQDSLKFDLAQRTGEANLEQTQQTTDQSAQLFPSRLRSATAGADTAEAGATTAASNARTTVATEPDRITTSGAGARSAVAGARSAESGARVSEATEPDRIGLSGAQTRIATARADVEQQSTPYTVRSRAAGARQAEAGATASELQTLTKLMDMVRAGDIEGAKHFSRESGLNIPDEVLDHAEARASLMFAHDRGKELYQNRPRDWFTYMQSYLELRAKMKQSGQSASDPALAYNVPGAPQPQETTGAHNYEIVNRSETGPDGKPVITSYRHDKRTGELTKLEGEGAFQRPTGAGGAAGGKTSVFQQKQAAWLAVHPGDNAGALDYASGRKQLTDFEVTKASLSMARSEIAGNFQMKFKNEAERTAAITKRAQEIAVQLRGNLGPAPAPAAPAAPAPAPAPRPAQQRPDMMTPGDGGRPLNIEVPQQPPSVPPGSAYSPSRQMWRAPDGTMFDSNGNPVQQ